MTDWRCPRGHPITAADRYDMWCETCAEDVIALDFSSRTPPGDGTAGGPATPETNGPSST